MPSGVQTCALDRKSTRLNSSHTLISYAVFCLKKKSPEKGSRRDPYGRASPQCARRCALASARRPLSSSPPAPPPLFPPCASFFFFFLRIGRPPSSTLFPSPPLSR